MVSKESKNSISEKPFLCVICYKPFSFQIDLTSHMKIHEGKPFICDFCDKKFKNSSDLIRHSRTHTGDKPYSSFRCDLCNKPCRDKGDFNKHNKSVSHLNLVRAQDNFVIKNHNINDKLTLMENDEQTYAVEQTINEIRFIDLPVECDIQINEDEDLHIEESLPIDSDYDLEAQKEFE